MRFRHKRRSRAVRRPGMRGDWVVGMDFNCPEEVSFANTCQAMAEDPPTPTDFSLIDSQDLLDKEDALTVVRIVGDVPMWVWCIDPAFVGIAAATCTIREGIYVAGADGALPTANVISLNPGVPGDVELDSWMWLRTRVFKFAAFQGGGGPGATVQFQSGQDYAPGSNDHLDIRVKRRLKRGQELVYTACSFGHDTSGFLAANGALRVQMQGHLRCYVKF